MRRVRIGAAALAAACGAVVLSACGGSGASPSSATGTTSSASPSTTRTSTTAPARRRPVVDGPPVGTHQSVHTNGADLSVTVLRVSALAATGAALLPGTRPVGVFVKIANDAGETYDSTASGDFSLVVSGGQALPLLVRSGPCATPLVDIESMIVSGVVRTGCVGFSVARSARVLGVRFSPHSRPAGTLSWRVSG